MASSSENNWTVDQKTENMLPYNGAVLDISNIPVPIKSNETTVLVLEIIFYSHCGNTWCQVITSVKMYAVLCIICIKPFFFKFLGLQYLSFKLSLRGKK